MILSEWERDNSPGVTVDLTEGTNHQRRRLFFFPHRKHAQHRQGSLATSFLWIEIVSKRMTIIYDVVDEEEVKLTPEKCNQGVRNNVSLEICRETQLGSKSTSHAVGREEEKKINVKSFTRRESFKITRHYYYIHAWTVIYSRRVALLLAVYTDDAAPGYLTKMKKGGKMMVALLLLLW